MLSRGQFFFLNEREHWFPWNIEHRDDEPDLGVASVVAVLVMDDVAARLPERLSGPDLAGRLAFQFKQQFTFQHVAECRPPGCRCAGAPRLPGGYSTTIVMASAFSEINGGLTCCTTVTALSQSGSYSFHIADSPSGDWCALPTGQPASAALSVLLGRITAAVFSLSGA